LQLAIQALTQTRDVISYQATVQDHNARPGMRDVIPVDTEWVEATANRNNRERDKLETELKTYSSNMIKESIRVSLHYY
jgi:COP9 signalosome complex subunit 1